MKPFNKNIFRNALSGFLRITGIDLGVQQNIINKKVIPL